MILLEDDILSTAHP